jgi:hypothetical protein
MRMKNPSLLGHTILNRRIFQKQLVILHLVIMVGDMGHTTRGSTESHPKRHNQ